MRLTATRKRVRRLRLLSETTEDLDVAWSRWRYSSRCAWNKHITLCRAPSSFAPAMDPVSAHSGSFRGRAWNFIPYLPRNAPENSSQSGDGSFEQAAWDMATAICSSVPAENAEFPWEERTAAAASQAVLDVDSQLELSWQPPLYPDGGMVGSGIVFSPVPQRPASVTDYEAVVAAATSNGSWDAAETAMHEMITDISAALGQTDASQDTAGNLLEVLMGHETSDKYGSGFGDEITGASTAQENTGETSTEETQGPRLWKEEVSVQQDIGDPRKHQRVYQHEDTKQTVSMIVKARVCDVEWEGSQQTLYVGGGNARCAHMHNIFQEIMEGDEKYFLGVTSMHPWSMRSEEDDFLLLITIPGHVEIKDYRSTGEEQNINANPRIERGMHVDCTFTLRTKARIEKMLNRPRRTWSITWLLEATNVVSYPATPQAADAVPRLAMIVEEEQGQQRFYELLDA
uniref:Uncharacterized protein n=1 Tax=Mycena chlorophos TaxID=658473 RepID=A0ABQ0LE10_MYCCL|nr:predicted protein [Mycena chlorophos]